MNQATIPISESQLNTLRSMQQKNGEQIGNKSNIFYLKKKGSTKCLQGVPKNPVNDYQERLDGILQNYL